MLILNSKRAKFYNVTDTEALKAGYFLSRLEGIIPALESAHALAILKKISLKKSETGEEVTRVYSFW